MQCPWKQRTLKLGDSFQRLSAPPSIQKKSSPRGHALPRLHNPGRCDRCVSCVLLLLVLPRGTMASPPYSLLLCVLSFLHHWPGNSSWFITNTQALLQAPFPLQCLQSTQETNSGLLECLRRHSHPTHWRREEGRCGSSLRLNFEDSEGYEDPVPTLWQRHSLNDSC